MRGVSSGKKTAGPQQKNLKKHSQADGKTRKNKQKPCGNGDGGNTIEALQPPWEKQAHCLVRRHSRGEWKIKIPEELKSWLVEDWDLVTRQKQLFQLSAKKNVDGNAGNKEYVVNKAVTGIKEYFTRLQYAKILLAHPDVPMSQAIVAHTPLDEKSLALLLGCLHDFLKHLAKDAMSLFTASDYRVASAENHHKAL
ncbi:hypothetical protein FD755_001043 [Muntiacus reevesi]|uniref:Mortality factor 4-like protein 2 n=1 Tax=Muntiacus reevesi TaxID=9886 RepID=A0A5J5N067_MUNRE|nr:hypothetical protein FD755_001043 [Muntiacus reevesi]